MTDEERRKRQREKMAAWRSDPANKAKERIRERIREESEKYKIHKKKVDAIRQGSEQYKTRLIELQKDPTRIKARQARDAAYRAMPGFKERQKKYQEKYRSRPEYQIERRAKTMSLDPSMIAMALEIGHCEVCGETSRLHVDHDHVEMFVRGLLCRWCNLALGHAHDSPSRLRALADYLEARAVVREAARAMMAQRVAE